MFLTRVFKVNVKGNVKPLTCQPVESYFMYFNLKGNWIEILSKLLLKYFFIPFHFFFFSMVSVALCWTWCQNQLFFGAENRACIFKIWCQPSFGEKNQTLFYPASKYLNNFIYILFIYLDKINFKISEWWITVK